MAALNWQTLGWQNMYDLFVQQALDCTFCIRGFFLLILLSREKMPVYEKRTKKIENLRKIMVFYKQHIHLYLQGSHGCARRQ